MFDILTTNGLVVDGTKQPATKLDIGIQGDHITAIDRLNGAEAKRYIDAMGLVVRRDSLTYIPIPTSHCWSSHKE